MSLASDATFTKIEARISKIDPNNREVENNNSYRFNITIDGAVKKTWILDLKNIKLTVGDGAADCTLTVSDADMVLLGNGGLNPKEAIAQDRLDIDGQLEVAMLLVPFISSL